MVQIGPNCGPNVVKSSPIKLVRTERNLNPIQILRKTFRWNLCPPNSEENDEIPGKKKSLQTHQRKHRNWRSNGGMLEHGNSYRYSGWRMDERYSSRWWYLRLLISSFQYFQCTMRQLYNFFFILTCADPPSPPVLISRTDDTEETSMMVLVLVLLFKIGIYSCSFSFVRGDDD